MKREAVNDPNKTILGAAPAFDPNKTIMSGAPLAGASSREVTVTVKPIQCPVCRTFNPVGQIYCIECGLIFAKSLDGDAFGAPAIQLPVLADSSGKEHPIRPGTNIIGRSGDIAIEDSRVSRRHASISYSNDTFTIEDLGSTNGTSVAGSRLSPGQTLPLAIGQILNLGGVELTLRQPGSGGKTQMPLSGKTQAIAAAPSLPGQAVAFLTADSGEVPLLPGTTYAIGRRDGNDIVIADPFVSGKHASLEVTEEGLFITDLGSTNGSFLNDAKLTPNQSAQIRPGDELRFGGKAIPIRFAGQ